MLKESGYQVLAASNAEAALELARKHPHQVHLLISDLIMPQMNGKELSEKLLEIRPDMKVLFTSGYSSDIISSHGIIEEGVLFLQKPVTFAALTSKVRDVLDAE